jgi:hypothetical protein
LLGNLEPQEFFNLGSGLAFEPSLFVSTMGGHILAWFLTLILGHTSCPRIFGLWFFVWLVGSHNLSARWQGEAVSSSQARGIPSMVHREFNKCLACEIKDIKKGEKYCMKKAEEARYGVINTCIRWEHWQAYVEKKIQEMSSIRDTCAIDTTRHVVDLRNLWKEVDAFMGVHLSRNKDLTLQVGIVKQLLQRMVSHLGISNSALVLLT